MSEILTAIRGYKCEYQWLATEWQNMILHTHIYIYNDADIFDTRMGKSKDTDINTEWTQFSGYEDCIQVWNRLSPVDVYLSVHTFYIYTRSISDIGHFETHRANILNERETKENVELV